MFLDNKKIAIYGITAIFLIIADRFLKIFALNKISFNLIGDFFTFKFSANYNIAFSLPLSGIFLNILILFIIIILLYYFVFLIFRKKIINYYFGLLILGAVSNYFDRIKYGFVIDYFDLKYFTVFNIADIMIVAGCLLLVINEFKKEKYVQRKF
jgi:signal peptidase II